MLAPEDPISVLLVDDHPAILEGVGLLVEHTDGLAVWGTAESGDDALAQLEATGPAGAARQDGPGVVVTDVRMPGMDGIELAAEVHTRWPALPCLVFSAEWSPVYAERARAAGAVGFVEKGDVSGLVGAIRRAGAL